MLIILIIAIIIILIIGAFVINIFNNIKNSLIFRPEKTYFIDKTKINSIFKEKNMIVNITENFINIDNKKIHYMILNNENVKNTENICLFSHGNSGNISLISTANAVCFMLKFCPVFIFDYSGYGKSSGEASEKNLYEDTKIAWSYLLKTYKPSDIILFGESLGCASVTDLLYDLIVIKKLKDDELPKGLILESGFYNIEKMFVDYQSRLLDQLFAYNNSYGISILSFLFKIFDNLGIFNLLVKNQFDNARKIKEIRKYNKNYPIIIFHNKEDQIINYDHSYTLSKETDSILFEIKGQHGLPIFDIESENLIRKYFFS
jgi:hypothetical protein